tara:strand:+ start:1198 stop:1512 length:315 start_codon:yes stop_codon:yes gene_type:complete
MNYTAVSGGTLTIGNEVNGRLQNKAVKIPASLNYLILALETRIGTIDNINFQISKEKNMSEERMVINYTTDPETFKNTKIIININDLYGSELLWYNNLIKEVNL